MEPRVGSKRRQQVPFRAEHTSIVTKERRGKREAVTDAI